MRVFILCTGRTGSQAIIKAFQHATNFTAGHESQARSWGVKRFQYPDQHIEADNRLSWQLGSLLRENGEEALYVHLTRDRNNVVNSFLSRYITPQSMIDAFCSGIRLTAPEKLDQPERVQAARDYVQVVNDNITEFLSHRQNTMQISIEQIESNFPKLWERIQAKGDLNAALKEFKTPHNRRKKRSLEVIYRSKLFFKRNWLHLKWWLGGK